jgi:hypothetical protein
MAYFIFVKYLRSLEEFRKNPHVKIPPKSPYANFQSLGNFKNPIFNSKNIFLRFRPGQPYGPLGLWPSRPRWPLSSHGTKPPLPAHLARASVASLQKYVFPSSSRLLSWSLLSRLSVTWARAIGFVFLPHRPSIAASSRRLRPPRAAINGVKTITTGHFPLPRPGVPLHGHFKRARSTPRPSPHSPRPQLLASESTTSTPPSASSTDCSPPSHGGAISAILR